MTSADIVSTAKTDVFCNFPGIGVIGLSDNCNRFKNFAVNGKMLKWCHTTQDSMTKNKMKKSALTIAFSLLAVVVAFTTTPTIVEAGHILCDGQNLTFHQQDPAGNNTIDGTDQADVLHGEGGDDTISGFENPAGTFDRLCGGSGRDDIRGGSGDDRIFGDAGLDVLDGGLGNDRIEGGIDADSMNGQGGSDNMFGQDGNDTLWHGNDNVADSLGCGPGTDNYNAVVPPDTVTACENPIN